MKETVNMLRLFFAVLAILNGGMTVAAMVSPDFVGLGVADIVSLGFLAGLVYFAITLKHHLTPTRVRVPILFLIIMLGYGLVMAGFRYATDGYVDIIIVLDIVITILAINALKKLAKK